MAYESFEDFELATFNEETRDRFVELNSLGYKNKEGMPANLRSMFTELTFIGALYRHPENAKKYADYISTKFDFTSDGTKFFYKQLIDMGNRTDWKPLTEYSTNAYMCDDKERLELYQNFGGYTWIEYAMRIADETDADESIEKYYNMIKNYSLLRTYWSSGMTKLTESMVYWKNFPSMKPRDILQTIQSNISRAYVKIANSEEVKVLTSGCEKYIEEKLERPEQGLDMPFPIMTEVFQGIRPSQFWAWGMLSNAGKSRFLIRLITNLAFVQDRKVLIISNEMTEDEMRACLITTAINNPDIQKLHNFDVGRGGKNQGDITNGIYYADAEFGMEKGIIGSVVSKLQGESSEEFIARLERVSSQFRAVKQIAHWIDTQMSDKIKIVETGSDYSDNDLKQIIENTCLSEGIEHVFYDTFKSDKDAMGEWAAMKKTATILSEIAKKMKIFIGANIQLTDDANMITPLELSSSNIANSKQIKHVLDCLCLFKEIPVTTYDCYRYWTHNGDVPKEVELKKLDEGTRYYVCRIDKNRAGTKPDLLFKLNLNTNIWEEVGRVKLVKEIKKAYYTKKKK